MTLAPLLAAPTIIQAHALAAISAGVLGLVQIFGPKGTGPHRILGWAWVVLMAAAALSSFWINQMRLVGPFGPIHLLSLLTLAGLVGGVRAARRHDVGGHRRAMRTLFVFALLLAGAFTLLPGRIMGAVVFGFPVHDQAR